MTTTAEAIAQIREALRNYVDPADDLAFIALNSLESEVEKYENVEASFRMMLASAANDRDKAQAEVDQLRAALTFYAESSDNYMRARKALGLSDHEDVPR